MTPKPISATKELRRILVPIDFSEDALRALQVAHDYFADADSMLIVVNAVEAAEAVSNKFGMRDKQIDTIVNNVRDQLQTLVNPLRSTWAGPRVAGRPSRFTSSPPPSCIIIFLQTPLGGVHLARPPCRRRLRVEVAQCGPSQHLGQPAGCR